MKRALLSFAAACAFLAPMAQAWAQDALVTDMMRRLKQRYPDLEVRFKGDDQVELLEGGQSWQILDLGNLRDICRNKPEECEQGRQRRVEMVAELRSRDKPAFALGDVRAVIRTVGYVNGVRGQFEQWKRGQDAGEAAKIDAALPLHRPLGLGFVRMWVQDQPNGMSPLAPRDLQREKLSEEDLDRASAANMAREDVPALSQARSHPSLWASGGNDYVGSVLVDEALWKRVAGRQAGEEVAVCLPERHVLIAYFPRLDPKREIDFTALCRRAATNGAPPFSDQVVRRINDNWQFK